MVNKEVTRRNFKDCAEVNPALVQGLWRMRRRLPLGLHHAGRV